MICSWFASTGHVVTFPLDECCTVNVKWYTEVCLPQMFAAVEDKHRVHGLQGLILYQDNAYAHTHTAQLTRDYLEEKIVKLVDHPP